MITSADFGQAAKDIALESLVNLLVHLRECDACANHGWMTCPEQNPGLLVSETGGQR